MAKFQLRQVVRRMGKPERRTVQEIREGDPSGEILYSVQLGTDFATREWAKESQLEAVQTIGHFVAEKLAEGKRRVAKSRNNAGFASLYGEIAGDVLKEYPDITAEEKAAVFGTLKGESELTKMRTKIDTSAGLADAKRILGV